MALLAPALEASLVQRLTSARSSSRREREAAFGELYEALRAPTLSLCVQLTRDPHEAEDVFHETFCAVLQGIGGFRGEARLATWVFRIALQVAFRHRAKARPAEPLDAAEQVASREGTPDQLATSRLELARLKDGFETLSAEQQAVLSLFAVEGLSHPEIASVLGIPEGTVWSRLHAARKRLREAIGS